jgi:hypothetical protein
MGYPPGKLRHGRGLLGLASRDTVNILYIAAMAAALFCAVISGIILLQAYTLIWGG